MHLCRVLPDNRLKKEAPDDKARSQLHGVG